jgi:NAD(P)-dependent dehydrogenase (short-subunit alcohol dehydrogenase family)
MAQSVIVTGGNRGIGFACAHAILSANRGWSVVLAARDPAAIAEAAARLKGETGGDAVGLSLDLGSQASIRAFAAEVRSHPDLPPLRGLICNAGVQSLDPSSRTADGFETAFGVNHLGHFLLVRLLLGALRPPARVIVVSSGTHDPKGDGRLHPPAWRDPVHLAFPEEDPGRPLGGMQRYATSKLANLMFAYELSRRLRGTDITVNAYDPGPVPETGLIRQWPAPLKAMVRQTRLMRVFGIETATADIAGARLARLLLDPALAGVTGAYFAGSRLSRSSDDSYDADKARDLWIKSSDLTGLAPDGDGIAPSVLNPEAKETRHAPAS